MDTYSAPTSKREISPIPGKSDRRPTPEAYDANGVRSGGNGIGGLHTYNDGETGRAHTTNRGTITTYGEPITRPDGATRDAEGIEATSQKNSALAENTGTITTWGFSANGIHAWSHEGSSGDTVTADNSGTVTTHGASGIGVFAGLGGDNGGSVTVVARNSGSVTTTGDNANGVIAFAEGGGTAASLNRVEAYNDAGATISTATDGSGGLGASIRTDAGAPMGGVDVFGRIYARNDGTITTAGGHGRTSAGDLAYGISVSFWTSDNTEINNAGDVEAVNTGTITVTGPEARGIQATTFGTGTATITVDGGAITASHDSATDAEDGVGIHASSGADGSIDVAISESVITAPQAMLFEGAPATLTISDSVLSGRMSFAGGDDTVTAQGRVTIVGDADFGGGEDRLILDVRESSIWTGNLTGLEYLTKRCPGDFTLAGNSTFSGSSVVIEEGGLVITGHMNLGTMGTVTVKDESRLTGLLTQGGTPKITAGGGTTVEPGGAITMQKSDDAGAVDAEQAVATFLTDANVQGGSPLMVQTQDGDGSLTELASFDPSTSMATPMAGAAVGTRSAEEFLDETTVGMPSTGTGGTGGGTTSAGTGGSGGGGSGGGGVAVGVGLMALLFALFQFDMGPEEAQASISPRPALVQSEDGETRYWARSLSQSVPSGGIDRSEGVEVGMEVGIGNGFSLGFSATPEVSAERFGGAQDALSVAGSRYSVSGGWQEDGLFAKLALSHADLSVDGSYENPTVGGGFRSQFGAEQNDVRLGAGARIDLGGGVTAVPQAGAFAGSVEREGHTSEGGVFRASMPSLTQRYSGVQAALGLASDWQEGPAGMKLRPSLNLTAMHVQAESPAYELRQSDRLGIMSTTSRARLPDASGTMYGLGAGLEATGAGGMRMRFGYAGAIVDGDVVHAVGAGLQMKF